MNQSTQREGALAPLARSEAWDMLIIGGTSLTVYPAAGLVDYYEGNKLVLINKSVTAKEAHADLVITEPIGQVFQRCVLGENCSEDAQTSDRR